MAEAQYANLKSIDHKTTGIEVVAAQRSESPRNSYSSLKLNDAAIFFFALGLAMLIKFWIV